MNITPIPYQHRCRSLWCRVPGFIIAALIFALVILFAGTWDFLRWLVSGIWPVEPNHPEKPGDHLS